MYFRIGSGQSEQKPLVDTLIFFFRDCLEQPALVVKTVIAKTFLQSCCNRPELLLHAFMEIKHTQYSAESLVRCDDVAIISHHCLWVVGTVSAAYRAES